MNKNQNDFLDYVVYKIYPRFLRLKRRRTNIIFTLRINKKGDPKFLLFEPLFLFYVVVGIKKHLIIDL